MKKGGPALILLNGELRDRAVLRTLAANAAVIICADGAVRHAKTLGLKPDYIVGDMDSLPRTIPRSWKKTVYFQDDDVNRSDLGKALDFAQTLGYRTLWLGAVLGGGIDHQFVNFSALEARAGQLKLTIIDGGLASLLGPGRYPLSLPAQERFSLLAAPRALVTLTGVRYPLNRKLLKRGTLGLGNHALIRPLLTIHQGHAWLMCPVGARALASLKNSVALL
jgi:thiamine pyrophosphokinase